MKEWLDKYAFQIVAFLFGGFGIYIISAILKRRQNRKNISQPLQNSIIIPTPEERAKYSEQKRIVEKADKETEELLSPIAMVFALIAIIALIKECSKH